MTPPEDTCPHCGATLRSGRRFCRECGASDDSGWDDGESYEFAQGEDPDFDYDEFVASEFPEHAGRFPSAWRWWVAVIVSLLLASLVMGSLF